MKLPEREDFINDLEEIENIEAKEQLINLYDNMKSVSVKNKAATLDNYKKVKKILNLLFNSTKSNDNLLVPFSFYETTAGRLILMALNPVLYFTTADIVELSKTPEKPQGLSFQYLAKEIKDGRLKAQKSGGRWIIPIMEVERYLSRKNREK